MLRHPQKSTMAPHCLQHTIKFLSPIFITSLNLTAVPFSTSSLSLFSILFQLCPATQTATNLERIFLPYVFVSTILFTLLSITVLLIFTMIDQIWQGLTCKEKKEMELHSLMATCGPVWWKLVIIHSLVPPLLFFLFHPVMLLWITTYTGSCAGMKNLAVFELGWKTACISLPSLWEKVVWTDGGRSCTENLD